MHKLLRLLSFYFSFCFISIQASSFFSQPSLIFHGIDLIKGKKIESLEKEYSYSYSNGKVAQIQAKNGSSFHTITLNYGVDYTELIYDNKYKEIYSFDQKGHLTELSHYLLSATQWQLYRKEKIFTIEKKNKELIVSRVVEDHQGVALLGYLAYYNPLGLLIKETIVGDLSGKNKACLTIDKSGFPLENGIENYSIYYEYEEKQPGLMRLKREDNGSYTYFQYDSSFTHCTAKLQGVKEQLLTRYFYEYDKNGFLYQTIVDDGSSFSKEDLTGVCRRKGMRIYSSENPSNFGQPLKVENFYFDLDQNKEVQIDQTVFQYTEDGKLINEESAKKKEIPEEFEIDEFYSNHPVSSFAQNPSLLSMNSLTGHKTSVADSYGNETISSYDVFNRLVKTELPAILNAKDESYHPTLEQSFNCLDQVTEKKEPGKEPVFYEYNIRNQPTKITYCDHSFEEIFYYLDGKTEEKRERSGAITQFFYDSFGRLILQKFISPQGKLLKELSFTYQGNLKESVKDHENFCIYYLYDQTGSFLGYQHDEKIKEEKEKSPIENLDADHSLKKNPTLFHREEGLTTNDRGQLVKTITETNLQGLTGLITYDALHRPEHYVCYNSIGVKVKEIDLRYNEQNQKVFEKHYRLKEGKVIDHYLIKWSYDLHGKLSEICEGVGTVLEKRSYYFYNLAGKLEKMIQPSGVELNYFYNDPGHLTRLQASDHSIHYSYIYDDRARLTQIEDLHLGKNQIFTYSKKNEPLQITTNGQTIQYTYDEQGRCCLLTLPDQTAIRYCYNDKNLQTIERLDQTDQVLYQHHYDYCTHSDQVITESLIKGLGKIDYQYDLHHKKTAISSHWWSQKILLKDEEGRILKSIVNDHQGEIQSHFCYSEEGYLSQEDETSYFSDSLFNSFSNQDSFLEVNSINQLLSTNEFQYAYDLNGNLIQKTDDSSSYFYQYDALNRLIRYEEAGKQAVEYEYDAFNRRIAESLFVYSATQKWEKQTGFYYLYDGMEEIGKVDENGKVMELRILADNNQTKQKNAIAFELQGRLFAPIYDSHGSARCLIDVSTKQVAEYYRFDSFGKEEIYDSENNKISSNQAINPWRYSGKRHDAITKLIFYGLRYYDATIRRWITPDPCSFYDTPNLYAFVRNDPLNHYDQYGLFSISTLWNEAKKISLDCYHYLGSLRSKAKEKAKPYFALPDSLVYSFEKSNQSFLCSSVALLMGYQRGHSHNGVYGEKEVKNVRITFINGILSTDPMLQENLDLISKSHGNVKVHYVFRGTNGWISDISKAIAMRLGYTIGYRSHYAYELATMWRELITEMGGVNGGGIIIHYAHSLGGCDTDRARTLLTPEEQKMIRVFTFGSATMIRNRGFQQVTNFISANDGVSSIFLEPLGRVRNFFDPNTNVVIYGTFSLSWWMSDHLLRGFTYQKIMQNLGQDFVEKYLLT